MDNSSINTSVTSTRNVDAFMSTIRQFEAGGSYTALVGGGHFTDFSHHPALPPSNWQGIVTKWGPSHAAGAYQYQPGTWKALARILKLNDFAPSSQDAGCVELLNERHALGLIHSSQFAAAVKILQPEWQSMLLVPLPKLAAFYQLNGGTIL